MSAFRDAVRLLFILVKGAEQLPQEQEDGPVAIFKGEARLHAFDFWIRYPDYLADELLNLFDKVGDRGLLDEVEAIFREEEPEIRRIQMIRYKFGAWERIDTAVSILAARRLVKRVEHRVGVKVVETDFPVFKPAFDLVKTIEREFPALRWYAQRTALVAQIAGTDGGAALKERQYKRMEYEATPLGSAIPSIKESVRARFLERRRKVA